MPGSYRSRLSAINLLSYSQLQTLATCPRRFELEKLTATGREEEDDGNPDFLYGHAVGAGIQKFLETHNREDAIFAAFLAWNGNMDVEKAKSKKSIWFALGAVEQFCQLRDALLPGWQLAVINGQPAVELSFSINLENGYVYFGHVDVVLWNPVMQKFMVLELKTSSFTTIHEAIYKNSGQALGYSIVLDKIASSLDLTATYDVLYLVYKTGAMAFESLPFVKTRTQRARWCKELLLNCEVINLYREHKHFPMQGSGCYSFFRACEFFETCQMSNIAHGKAEVPTSESMDHAVEDIAPEFRFSISELVQHLLDSTTTTATTE